MATTSSITSTVPRPKSTVVVPTNTVSTKEGKTVRARIDPTLPVSDVIRQLCHNLKVQETPKLFALRDDTDDLVTDDNLRKKILDKVPLKLVNAPVIEAAEIVDKLSGLQESTIKMTLFSLQKFIREEQFANEFLKRDGLSELVHVINISHGNTLAYALNSMRNLMELDHGWHLLDAAFIYKVSQILSTPLAPINVCRPATAILKKLVEASPSSLPSSSTSSSTTKNTNAAIPPGSIWRYGFEVVWTQMRRVSGLMDVVVQRLGSAESGMAIYSMMLINSLMSHATDSRWEELSAELERLNVRKVVIGLMSSHTIEDLTSSILDFQANIVRLTYRRKTTPVDADLTSNAGALEFIWRATKLSNGNGNGGGGEKWVQLGFEGENLRGEFARVGLLGLDCLKGFVAHDPEYFAKVILEQVNRPPERRCPVAKASNEVVELLSEHWSVFAPGYSTSTSFQPFLLSFGRVHNLATQFFLRMWNESGATSDDFSRVVALVQSQIKVSLRDESDRAWHEVEQEFLDITYRDVRDRQMRELELQDDLLNKVPVRNLRAKLYKESYDFVRQQRIHCLMQGAWFVNGIPISSSSMSGGGRDSIQFKRPQRPWRFLRLDKTMKYLYFTDSAVKIPIRGGLEDLPDRIEVSLITEITTRSAILPPGTLSSPDPSNSSPGPSPLSFSLLSTREGSLADQIAENSSRFSDWIDGLNMLRRDGGHVGTRDTEAFVQALTEIGLKIKLLDLSGEKVEIPGSLMAGPPPSNIDFYFSEPVMFPSDSPEF